MRAILTRYLPPTNTRGSRIKATSGKCSVTLSWNYSWDENIQSNHIAAAQALREKMGWIGSNYGPMYTGGFEDGDYCHVMTWKG